MTRDTDLPALTALETFARLDRQQRHDELRQRWEKTNKALCIVEERDGLAGGQLSADQARLDAELDAIADEMEDLVLEAREDGWELC